MAVQQLQLPTNQINNLADQAQWSTLGNLGNVYQEAQDRARQQQTLAALGTDPTANIAVLLKSGNPQLVQLGLRLQQEQVANRQAGAYLSIAQARAQREQEAADLAEQQRLAAPGLYTRLLGGAAPGAAPGGAPSPFPTPVPGAGATLPDFTTRPSGTLFPLSPPPPPPPQATPPTPPSAGLSAPSFPPLPPQAAPPTPPAMVAPSAGLSAPPISGPPAPTAATTVAPPIPAAADEGPDLPAWVGSQSLAGRMINTLASGQPAAAAGIDNKTLGEALANPETKALATVFAQNKLDPGSVKIEKTDDGRIIAIRTTKDGNITTRDVTPPTPGGGPPMTKEDRERQNIYDDAIRSGFSPQAALFMKFNKGKPPSESMTPMEIKTFNDLNNTARTADVFVSNLKRMKELSKTAYEGYGAQTMANIGTGALGEHAPQAALDTQKMLQLSRENAALQLRSTFGSRPAVVELQYLQQLESNPLMSRPQREDIYKRLIERFSEFSKEDKDRAQAIQEGTAFRKGPGNLAAPPPPETAAVAPPPPPPAAPPAEPNGDLAAAKWARDNPNDPRAQAIMQHLRGK